MIQHTKLNQFQMVWYGQNIINHIMTRINFKDLLEVNGIATTCKEMKHGLISIVG
ncbi:hypothetical protein Scep_026228 [Stephania cephalantha]|uniref:Uncharacterized protein n=1 Tax=Stephania cephalantha TaxID=152367 RepID=A0AAP0EK55_9MAGN